MREVLAMILSLLALPTSALADTCTAIPDTGPLPPYLSFGATFSGDVVEVIDGDSLCVAVGPRPGADWVEVRLADFSAPEIASPVGRAARAALQRVTAGKRATCAANMRTHDRIAARCRIDGQSISDLLRAAGVGEGGNGAQNARGFSSPALAPAFVLSPSPRGLSCAELRARGGARRGEPGYRADRDGDNDGIACEPYRAR